MISLSNQNGILPVTFTDELLLLLLLLSNIGDNDDAASNDSTFSWNLSTIPTNEKYVPVHNTNRPNTRIDVFFMMSHLRDRPLLRSKNVTKCNTVGMIMATDVQANAPINSMIRSSSGMEAANTTNTLKRKFDSEQFIN